jgi:hypothetical protein
MPVLRRPLLSSALAVLVAGAAATAAHATEPPTWSLQLSAQQHSDALPLSRFDADDNTAELVSRHQRDLAYLDHELRLSHTQGAHRISLVTRQSATLVASRDAIDLVAEVSRLGQPAGDRAWSAQGRYLAFAGSGLAWQTRFQPARDWQLDLGAQGLMLQRWRERRISGAASYRAATHAYRFDLNAFEADDELAFPYQRSFAPRGYALLLDGALRWQGERHAARLSWRDVGRLQWRGLPQNSSVLSSETQTYDADGYVVYEPLIQGQNSQPTRRRNAPARVTLTGEWQVQAGTTLEARGEWLQSFGVLPALAVSHTAGDWRYAATWRTHERRLTLGLGWRALTLQLGADRLGPQAHSREVLLVGAWPM